MTKGMDNMVIASALGISPMACLDLISGFKKKFGVTVNADVVKLARPYL